MRVYGLDFTSAPSKRKPLIVVGCKLDGDTLRIESAEVLGGFKEFERFLEERRPWACGTSHSDSRVPSSKR